MDCKKCGECCKWIIVKGRKPHDEDQITLWETRGAKFLAGDLISIPSTCPWYDEKEKCTRYESRPQACRDYDAGSEACLVVRKIRRPSWVSP